MPEYQCSFCGYKSSYKINLQKHINKKNKCSDKAIEILEIDTKFDCEYCCKSFNAKNNLIRHLKTCKVKKEDLQKQIRLQQEEIRELKEELKVQKALAEKPTNVTINNVNNNNINLTAYNNPNLENIEEFFNKCAKKQFMCIPNLIELIHFNKELPENHNLLLSNFRSDTMKAFNGKRWQTDEFERIVNNLINTYERDLEEWAGDDPERLTHLKNWEKIKKRDGEDVVYADLKHEIRKLMYDYRGMIKIKN